MRRHRAVRAMLMRTLGTTPSPVATGKLLRCGRTIGRASHVSDRPIRYGMIVLDVAPAIERVRGQPMIFRSPEETVEYAKLHAFIRVG